MSDTLLKSYLKSTLDQLVLTLNKNGPTTKGLMNKNVQSQTFRSLQRALEGGGRLIYYHHERFYLFLQACYYAQGNVRFFFNFDRYWDIKKRIIAWQNLYFNNICSAKKVLILYFIADHLNTFYFCDYVARRENKPIFENENYKKIVELLSKTFHHEKDILKGETNCLGWP